MRKKAIYCLCTCILLTQLFLVNVFPCRASEIGSGVYPVESESENKQQTPPSPVITAVSVSPETTVVLKGSSYAFVASVAGRNDYSREVAWSVHGQTSQNTYIDGSGILHVGFDETSSSLIVKAVSKQDSGYSATALATVQASSYSIQVNASPDNGGTVRGGGTVKEGGYTVITASPNAGYTFEGWLLNNNRVSGNSQYTVENIHSDAVYTAEFKPVDCRVTINVNDSNAGTATESKTVKYGESMTLEATAKEGYQFDNWIENGTVVSTDSRFQLNHITDARNLTAMFSQRKYNLTITGWPASTGTVSGQGAYDKGSNVKITAVPAGGYRFVSWAENGNVVSTDPEYSVNNVTRDMFFVATFEKVSNKTYTITASAASPNGKIVPEGKSSVAEGSGLSYVIMPEDGYLTNAVYVDGKSVGAVSSYSFSDVRGNHTISADFVARPGQDGSNEAGDKENDKTGDESLSGIEEEDTQAEETQELTGTLQHMDISVPEAEQMIDEKKDAQLMTGALETGDLKVTVHNDFMGIGEEASSVSNLETAVDRLLTKEEKMEMLKGNAPVAISFSIDDTDGEESQSTQASFEENKLPGMTIGRYFEINLTKSGSNKVQAITELSEKLKVVITVPKHLQAENREFYILRLHTNEDGNLDYTQLLDEDNNPDTITFSTDRFSPYAIAYIDWLSENANIPESAEHIDHEQGIVNVIAIMVVAIAAVITLWFIWYLARRKKR